MSGSGIADARMTRTLALLFLVGGSFAAVALVLPHPPGSNTEGIVTVALIAYAGAGAEITVWMVTVGTATVSGALIGSLVHRLEGLADTDVLTSLPNRRAWERFASAELARCARYKRPMSVALIDVDHFKEINDEMGHQVGDRLLQRLASAWRDQVRVGDLLGRVGGDEFAVVLPVADRAGVEATIKRLIAAVPEHPCTVGVALWDGRESLERLLGRADAALYQGKQGGRGQAVFADGTSGGDGFPPMVATP